MKYTDDEVKALARDLYVGELGTSAEDAWSRAVAFFEASSSCESVDELRAEISALYSERNDLVCENRSLNLKQKSIREICQVNFTSTNKREMRKALADIEREAQEDRPDDYC